MLTELALLGLGWAIHKLREEREPQAAKATWPQAGKPAPSKQGPGSILNMPPAPDTPNAPLTHAADSVLQAAETARQAAYGGYSPLGTPVQVLGDCFAGEGEDYTEDDPC